MDYANGARRIRDRDDGFVRVDAEGVVGACPAVADKRDSCKCDRRAEYQSDGRRAKRRATRFGERRLDMEWGAVCCPASAAGGGAGSMAACGPVIQVSISAA